MIAHPQADEVTLALRFGVIDKRCAAVTKRAVVDKLDLTRFEIEVDRQPVILERTDYARWIENGALAVAAAKPGVEGLLTVERA